MAANGEAMASVFYELINTNFRMETTKEDCKQISAEENNFDSFNRAIRYIFNRPLLESEHQFIHKIIDDAMDKYAQVQVKNCAIAGVGGQRELLKAFCLHGGIQLMVPAKAQDLDELINDFLESL
jgi:hypothetical protein